MKCGLVIQLDITRIYLLNKINKRVAIIIPVYNEGINGKILLGQLDSVLSRENYIFTVYFVEDGSDDKVFDHIEKNILKTTEILVLSLELAKNYGHQTALNAGLIHASECDALIMMDGDLQHPVEVIPKFLRAWESGNLIVQGIRRDVTRRSLKSTFSNIFYNVMNLFNSRKNFKKGASDFRLIDRKIIDTIYKSAKSSAPLRGLIPSLGINTHFIEYNVAQRIHGTSKFTLKKMFKLGINNFFLYSNSLLIISFSLAFFMLFLIMVFSFYIIWERLVLDILVPGQASILISILLASFSIISIQIATLIYVFHTNKIIISDKNYVLGRVRQLNEI